MSLLERRTSGVLLHPTSLPGPHGIGDLGASAHAFVEFLSTAQQQSWQMLPTVPHGRSYSPYDGTSALAGNALLIALEPLAEAGLLEKDELAPERPLPAAAVDFPAAIAHKGSRLRLAFDRAERKARWRSRVDDFAVAHADWAPDFALFAALRQAYRRQPWAQWDEGVRRRRRRELERAAHDLEPRVRLQLFMQMLFHEQWLRLRRHAERRGVSLIGDLPIYVAMESADVWSHPELFDLRPNGTPRTVTGVPPDYFNRNGQLWGTPTYRWDRHVHTGFDWWARRLQAMLAQFDTVRLDHFIGFHRYWSIPGGAKTARRGKWKPGPGQPLFRSVFRRTGRVPLIAEDLGATTPEVSALRDACGFRGMRILQFAFDGSPRNLNLPHNLPTQCVVYPGTHDNKTAAEWARQTKPDAERRKVREIRAEREFALTYLNGSQGTFHWDLIRAGLSSVADTFVVSVQDLLGLGRDARMNRPGTSRGNWSWRLREGRLTPELASRLGELTEIYGRARGGDPREPR